ncbi:regulatory protein RecX [Thermogemmatispora aurantia]|jgi:regulatory protein|uniref:Regulatory protein RecX n=1 Tax=Thermogemmatispora aurantia TaxID=2045279 RepID=A0A5J4K7J8_9CHLR|nr:RecX family transcriptional regulator [Thermogemmatispora aurantia]GER84598.1 regulatory protein RecX [Thermogemmatispora aurantia]
MQITAIEPQANKNEQVNLFVDGQRLLTVNVLVVERLGLAVGQELSPELLARLRREAALQQALDRALNYLSFRPRSRQEVHHYLRRRGVAPDLIEAVLERLTELGLVDDRAFATFWVESRERFHPEGARALQSELRARGVAPEIAAEVVKQEDDEERALQAGRKKVRVLLRGGAARNYEAFRNQLGAFLLRRGFSYETAKRVVRQLWHESRASAADVDPADPTDEPMD